MAERLVSGLVIVTGILSGGVGVTAAAHALHTARRAHQRTAARYAAIPDGWEAWFSHGFSGLTFGARWLKAAGILCGWTAAGLCLIWLGVRLFCRA